MIRRRHAARAILVTPNREILLLRIQAPGDSEFFWITPGGGLEEGETVESGLRRELREELGLVDFHVGPLVWRRQHTFDWGDQRICQSEQYFVVHVPRFKPRIFDDEEMRVVDTIQWWPVADLGTIPDRLTPLSLAAIVENYLSFGPPKTPPEIEVLID